MGKAEQNKKTSCLACRRRKKKCLGGNPCQRCMASNTECIYTIPSQKGRPPKNGIVNKLVLARGEKSIAHMGSTTMCKEFIFEQFSYGKVISQDPYPAYNNSKKGNNTFTDVVTKVYLSFFGPENEAANAIAKLNRTHSLRLANMVKMHDVQTFCTWTSAQVANILIRRFSRMKLESFTESVFALASIMMDDTSSFFELGSQNIDDESGDMVNPLNSLPPQQAMRMIECFFCIHPFCHLLNKTLILQSYWSDSADPLLMTVIYGTTAYYSNLLDSRPLFLWETVTSKDKRNPFLDYAYCLLDKADEEPTLARYQAVVILALFEVQHGYGKKGVALFGLAHFISSQLGVGDPEARGKMTEVEQELLIMTFWADNNCIIRGCLELDQVPKHVEGHNSVPLPPPTAESSASYLYDVAHNNDRVFFNTYAYLTETFYAESVIAHFATHLFSYFPQTSFNLFRMCWPQIVLQTSRSAVDMEAGIQATLQEFTEFVADNRHLWTLYQRYTIGATLLLYKIHFSFVKDYVRTAKMITGSEGAKRLYDRMPIGIGGSGGGVGPQQEEELGLDDIDVILRMDQVAPMGSELVAMTLVFLADPNQYDARWLPRSIIVACLETSARIAILKHKRDRDLRSWQDLEDIDSLTTSTIWQGQWSSIDTIKAMVDNFFQSNPIRPDPSVPSVDTELQQQLVPATAAAAHWMADDLALVQHFPMYPYLSGNEFSLAFLTHILSPEPETCSTITCNSSSVATVDGLFTVDEWIDY